MFADRIASLAAEPDLSGTVSFGILHCPSCAGPKEFVSYDERERGLEHAECFECGYCYGYKTEIRVDPESGRTWLEEVPVLDEATVREARRKLKTETVRALLLAGQQPHEIVPVLPNLGQRGPVPHDDRALQESMRAAGMSEEEIERVYGATYDR